MKKEIIRWMNMSRIKIAQVLEGNVAIWCHLLDLQCRDIPRVEDLNWGLEWGEALDASALGS